MTRVPIVVSMVVCLAACEPAVVSELDAGRVEDAGASGGGGGGASFDGGAGGGGGSTELDAGADAGAALIDAGTEVVPLFVAVGKQGRRAISCDDGLTWRADVSVDDAWPPAERYRCFSGDFALPDGGTQGTDCDHNAWSSTSVAFLGEAFVQTMGWGAPGTFHRTTDGVAWQQVFMGANVQDVMFGNGRAIAATRGSRRSDDLGATWTSGPEIPLSNGSTTIWNVRGGVFGGTGTGAFLVVGQDGNNTDFAASLDNGVTWQRPSLQGGGRIDACGAGKPSAGGGLFLTMSWSSSMNATVVCRSADNAATWTSSTIPDDVTTRPLWTGTEFIAWSAGKVHRSVDGTTWTSAATRTLVNGAPTGGPRLGAVARSAAGTFVGVKGGWQVWYEQQRFYRSTDGLSWDELPESAARRGHPITAIDFGFGRRSAVCP